MDYLTYKNKYWDYYLQMENDFFSFAPYCEIDESNKNTYSIKYLQLLLSICGEIDTILKSLCKKLDNTLDENACGIDDYIKILNEKKPKFATETISVVGYKLKEIVAWKSISKGFAPNFWSVYNSVKHHRDLSDNYKKANQKNVLEALCALYIAEEYWIAHNFINPDLERNDDMGRLKSKRFYIKNWVYYKYFNCDSEYLDTKEFLKYMGENK